MGEQFGTPYTVAGPGRAPRTGTAGDTWYRRTEPRPSSSAGARFTQEEGGKKDEKLPDRSGSHHRINRRGRESGRPLSGVNHKICPCPALRCALLPARAFPFFLLFLESAARPSPLFYLFFSFFLCLAPARLLSPSCYTIQALGEAAVIAGFSALSLSGEASPVLGLNDQPAPLHDKTIFL